MQRKTPWSLCLVLVAAFALMSAQPTAAAAKQTFSGVVNVNTATAEELATLPGIGPSKAAAIVEYRKAAKFETTADLLKVRGIGPKLLSAIEDYVRVSGQTTLRAEKANNPSPTTSSLKSPTAGGQS